MKLRLKSLKASRSEALNRLGHLDSDFPKLTNPYIYEQTGCSPATLTGLMNGTRISLRCNYMDALTKLFKSYGFTTDEIWDFEDIDLPVARGTRI